MKFSPKKSVHALSLTALVLMAVLAGCSSEADGNPELEETTDASSPEPTEYVPASAEGPAQNVPEPRLPAVATEDTEEGARATVEFFWQAEQYARQSGETGPLKIVSTEDCEFCLESIQGWPVSFEEGVWGVTEEQLVVDITDVHVANSDGEVPSVGHVYFKLHEPATQFYDEQGMRKEESFEKPELTEWFALLLYDATAQKWTVDWVGLEEAITWENE